VSQCARCGLRGYIFYDSGNTIHMDALPLDERIRRGLRKNHVHQRILEEFKYSTGTCDADGCYTPLVSGSVEWPQLLGDKLTRLCWAFAVSTMTPKRVGFRLTGFSARSMVFADTFIPTIVLPW
jgi:hypothetical protein